MALPQTVDTQARSTEGWIASNRTPILLILAGVVAISGFQFVSGLVAQQKEEKAWAAFLTAEKPGGDKDKSGIASAVKGTSAEAWYLLSETSDALEKEDFAKAKSWLAKIEQLGASELKKLGSPTNEGEALQGMVLAKIHKFEDWKAKNARFFQNPDPAAKPRIRFVTDAGEFVVALYPDRAKTACDNIIKLCQEGFYKETKLFEVFQGLSIRAGDPSTRAEAPESWTNQGAGYELDADKNSLFNFQWSVSMYRTPGQEKTSGSQFVISLQNQLSLDAPVFGVITEGRELLKEIGDAGAEFKSGKSVPKKLVTIKETRVEE